MSAQSHVVPPLWLYLCASAMLFFLTAVTVITSRFHLGTWELPLAIALATCKSLIVFLIFMGLLWEKSVNPVIMLSTTVFVLIFFLIVLADIVYRGDINAEMSLENVHGLRSPKPKKSTKPKNSSGNSSIPSH